MNSQHRQSEAMTFRPPRIPEGFGKLSNQFIEARAVDTERLPRRLLNNNFEEIGRTGDNIKGSDESLGFPE